MSALKKQHFLPQFYMRNFGIQNPSNDEVKQIGLFNLRNKVFIPNASIKDQAFKKNYYDNDGNIEKALSEMEDKAATLIREVILQRELPKDIDNIIRLLSFVSLTYYRNPVLANKVLNEQAEMDKHIKNAIGDENLGPEFEGMNLKQIIVFLLSFVVNTRRMLMDLKIKLLINESITPFITSDNPIVLYNQLTELKKWPFSGYGIISRGLQIFAPLSPTMMIVLYDDWAYKFVNKRQVESFEIKDTNVIEQLNILQCKNCSENLYFSDTVSRAYIVQLFEKSKKFPNVHVAKVKEFGNVGMQAETGIQTGLSVPFFNTKKVAKQHKPTIGWQAMRPEALSIMEKVKWDKPGL